MSKTTVQTVRLTKVCTKLVIALPYRHSGVARDGGQVGYKLQVRFYSRGTHPWAQVLGEASII